MTNGLPARDEQVTPGMMITAIRQLTSRAEVAERQIAHLADRISVVQVQAQGDAKIRDADAEKAIRLDEIDRLMAWVVSPKGPQQTSTYAYQRRREIEEGRG